MFDGVDYVVPCGGGVYIAIPVVVTLRLVLPVFTLGHFFLVNETDSEGVVRVHNLVPWCGPAVSNGDSLESLGKVTIFLEDVGGDDRDIMTGKAFTCDVEVSVEPLWVHGHEISKALVEVDGHLVHVGDIVGLVGSKGVSCSEWVVDE